MGREAEGQKKKIAGGRKGFYSQISVRTSVYQVSHFPYTAEAKSYPLLITEQIAFYKNQTISKQLVNHHH